MRALILIHPGAYSESSSLMRTYFRSTLAHNTIRVNQQDISQISGRFYLWPHTQGKVIGCYQNTELLAIEAQHSSYMRLQTRVMHKRVVLIFGAKYVVIVDELTGTGSFFAERMFHFAPGEIRNIQDQWHWQANGRARNTLNGSTTKLQEEIVMGRDPPFWAGMLSFGGSG